MVRTNFLGFLIIFCLSTALQAQPKKYIVYFSDKNNNLYTLSHPEDFLSARALERRNRQGISLSLKDLPVSAAYLDSIRNKGATVLYPLKWLNAAVVIADNTQLSQIQALPFVLSEKQLAWRPGREDHWAMASLFETHESHGPLAIQDEDYGNAYRQIEMLSGDRMHQLNFHGEGIWIAVLDGGFNNVNNLNCFASLFSENRIAASYDVVDQETDVYDDHNHGTQVLSLMAAEKPGTLMGMAYKATYILVRTEDVSSENEIEEAHWARGAEYADSLGADIINSSLGYSTFDLSANNHVYADMDGDKTLCARAADQAAACGMIVVASAGNDGTNGWHYISTPADGDSVIAVGSVNSAKNSSSFSSYGPAADGAIKPDLSAMGENAWVAGTSNNFYTSSGTSFAAPLLSGLVAGLWQANGGKNNMQILNALRKTADHYLYPDDRVGYGIPDFNLAHLFLNNDSPFIYPNPSFGTSFNLLIPENLLGLKGELRIYNELGQILGTFPVSLSDPATQVNLPELPCGLYFTQLITSSHNYAMVLVKN